MLSVYNASPACRRHHLLCERRNLHTDGRGTRAETRCRLSAKRANPFKSAEALVQSTNGSLGVRMSGSNARYTMFRGGVKSTGYPLHSPVTSSLPLPCVTVCHHVSTGVYHSLCETHLHTGVVTNCVTKCHVDFNDL